MHSFRLSVFISAALLAVAHASLMASSVSEPHWEGSVGLGFRSSGDLTLRTEARTISGANYDAAATEAALLAAVGSASANTNRTYDNGAVAQGSSLGLTAAWSYQAASQVAASTQNWGGSGTQSLFLSRSGPLAVNSAEFSRSLRAQAAPMAELRRVWAKEENRQRGFALGWTYLNARSANDEALETARTLVRDEFYLRGVIAPQAPYVGSSLPPGPLIDNHPVARKILSAVTGTSGRLAARSKLEMHTLYAGGFWRWFGDSENLHVNLQGGLSANFATFDYEQHVALRDGASPSDLFDLMRNHTLRLGYYVAVDLEVPVREDTWVALRARYDGLPTMQLSGPSAAMQAQLSGWSVFLKISHRL